VVLGAQDQAVDVAVAQPELSRHWRGVLEGGVQRARRLQGITGGRPSHGPGDFGEELMRGDAFGSRHPLGQFFCDPRRDCGRFRAQGCAVFDVQQVQQLDGRLSLGCLVAHVVSSGLSRVLGEPPDDLVGLGFDVTGVAAFHQDS
jgi:hypothetical protein